MNRRVRVKPSKGQSLVGFFVGLIFCFIGIFQVIPTFGMFGLFWTAISAVITILNGYNAFTDKGVATHEIVIDDMENSQSTFTGTSANERLTELQNLYDKNLITTEEYKEKRKKILDEI